MTTEGNVIRVFPQPQRGRPVMPPETPSKMPLQSFAKWSQEPERHRIPQSEASASWRRVLVFSGALGLIGWAIWQMYLVLAVAGVTPLEWAVLVLFSINFAWIGLSFSSATAGFFAVIVMRLTRRKASAAQALKARTAVIVPMYNEAPDRVLSGIEAGVREIAEAGESHSFDFFVLSDTTHADHALLEEAAFLKLRERLGESAPVYYRRRRHNEARKVGNIMDFCTRWGGRYDFMLVFDADSMMSAQTMITLAQRMEDDPGLGLLQTIPMIINSQTLFARIQQFAARAYGTVLGAGLAWWTQNEGNYWGHNAIIRVKAFMESAGLSELRGRPPFGGAILSHDFVEAALLRRAGWKVRAAMDLNGSYEECPPSLLDLALRDRRWCQGNLQHSRLITTPGLHWVSRMHFISGIMSYLASPLWLLLILSGFALALQAQFVRPEYFPDYFTFFPEWPIIDPARALALFFATMTVLLMPKLYGYILLIFDKKWRNEAGGVVHGAISVLMEIVLSALIAPIMMLIQTGAVFGVLRGRDTGWKPQRRDGGEIAFSAIAARHARHVVFGLVLTVGALAVSPALAAWMSPTLIGLLLAIVLSAWTASRKSGAWAKRLGLFLTPEEVEAPRVASRAESARQVYVEATAQAANILRLAGDVDARAAHLDLIESEQRYSRGRFDAAEIIAAAKIDEAASVHEALELMTPAERQALVNSRKLITALAAKSGP